MRVCASACAACAHKYAHAHTHTRARAHTHTPKPQYVSTLRGMTKGRAQYTMQLEKYDVVPNQIQEKIVAASGKTAAA